jgi:S1-C subfamily serine protease
MTSRFPKAQRVDPKKSRGTDPNTPPPETKIALTPDKIFKLASPATVKIIALDDNSAPLAQGSGFYVDNMGTIVTNDHVISGASYLEIVDADGTTHSIATAVAVDAEDDLAILSVPRKTGAYVQLGARLPEVGSRVYALGSPRGLTNTLSEGIISGLRNTPGIPRIQCTAAISPGSSGGPLLSADATVVGVTTAYRPDGEALNFAIPVNEIRELLASRGEPLSLASMAAEQRKRTTDEAITRAWSAIEAGEYAQAVAMLDPFARTQQENEILWSTLGFAYNMLRDDSRALHAFDKCIAIAPEDAMAHWVRGEVLMRLNRQRDAAADYDCAIDLKLQQSGLYVDAGNCYAAMGDATRADQLLTRARQLDPSNRNAYISLGRLYMDQGWNDEALGFLQRAVSLEPSNSRNAGLYLAIGALHSQMRHYDKAFAAWRMAVALDPLGPIGEDASRRMALLARALQ